MCNYCQAINEKHFSKPKMGDLRVWWIPQIPSSAHFHYPVKDIEQAKLLLTVLAQYDLYQLEHDIKPDYSNVGGLEVYDDQEEDWVGWEDEDGNDIDLVMDMEEAEGDE